MSMQLQFEASSRFPAHTTAGTDHRGWARRIQYREQHGDKSLLPIQIRFAREALDARAEVPA